MDATKKGAYPRGEGDRRLCLVVERYKRMNTRHCASTSIGSKLFYLNINVNALV